MSVYTIYRYIYNDETIYVGKTKRNLKIRIYEHTKEDKFLPYIEKCQIEYFDAGNRQSMDIYEKYLINEMLPILNVADKDNARFTFSLPYIEWIPYEMYTYNKKSPDKEPFKTVSKDIKINQKRANIQRSIKACQNRIEKKEKELKKLQNLLHFLAWNSIEDFNSDALGDVYFENYGELPICIHAVIKGEHEHIPVYTKGCRENGSNIITYKTKMEYLEKVFKYGFRDLSFNLKAITDDIIRENMFLRERELEKENLYRSIVA